MAITTSTLTTFDFALKERYTAKKVESLCYSNHPFMAMVNKDESYSGDNLVVPLKHVYPQGVAGDSVATAQTNATNVGGKKFNVTVGDYNGSVYIGDKVLTLSRNNEGAFLRNKVEEIDALYEQMSMNLATYAWRNGGNSIGEIGSIATDTITLADATQAMFFEEQMECVFSADDGSATGHTLRDSAANARVASVDREAGTVTFVAGELALVAGLTAGDFIFREGDFYGDTGTVILFGVPAFIWSSSSPPSLYGMTRTSDAQRLAGSRVPSVDIGGMSNEERIQYLGAYMTGRYKTPGFDKGFLHPEDWQNLAISLESKGVRSFEDKDTQFGFEAISFVSGNKRVKLYGDAMVQKGTFFGLRMQDWTMYSAKRLIHPIDEDGLTIIRSSNANTYEHRLVSYPALVCKAPGLSGRVALQ